MPKKGPDKDVMRKIEQALRENPEGLWIREIARKTNIPKSTVHYYLVHFLKDKIEDSFLGGNLIRMITLRGSADVRNNQKGII